MSEKDSFIYTATWIIIVVIFILVFRSCGDEENVSADVSRYERERDSLVEVNRILTDKIRELSLKTDSVTHYFEKIIEEQKKEYHEKAIDLTRLSDDEHIRLLSDELSREDSLE